MTSKSPIPAFVPKAPDAIMAEVWRNKQQINAESGYDIDKLLARVKRECHPASGRDFMRHLAGPSGR